MFVLTKEAHDFIEQSQFEAIQLLGVSEDEIDELFERAIRNKSAYGNVRPEFLEEIQQRYENSSLDEFYLIVPEHPYDTSFDFYAYMALANVTKYDDPNFINRFTNLSALCHEFYTESFGVEKRNIILTSLPFLDMNGVCLKFNQEADIIFMNSGLLSILPKIYESFLPLCEPSLFGQGQKGRNLGNTLDILTSSHFFESSFKTMMDNADVYKPNAKEKWYFQELLRESVEKETKQGTLSPEEKQSMFSGHPSNFPFSHKMGQFYACRGAYAFLLGHEYSHAYNEHNDIKDLEDINLRGENFLEQLEPLVRSSLSDYEGLNPVNDNYCLLQPIEEEADAHGLLCVIKYCADNELDDQRTMCVLVGAISVFAVMHIQEHLMLIRNFTSLDAKEYLSIPAEVRNILFRGEHPEPISRLKKALAHDSFSDHPMKPYLAAMERVLVKQCETFSAEIERLSDSIEKELNSEEQLHIDLSAIFNHETSLGSADISKTYLSKIKQHFKPKRKNNVVSLTDFRKNQ